MTWWQSVLMGFSAVGVMAGAVVPVYWTMVQADPRIVACESPVMNDGTGLDTSRSMAIPGADWTPVARTTFKAGETAWVLRNDMFLNKVSGPVQRALIHEDGRTIYPLPLIYPPKTTPSGQCSRANFAIPLPRDLKPGTYTYSVNVIMRKNPLESEVFTPFPPVRLAIVE